MLNDLSEKDRALLSQLRSNPDFKALLMALRRTSLRPWVNRGHSDKEKMWIYESGMIAGEQHVIDALLTDPLNARI